MISGNFYGVELTDAGTSYNWVEGDLIGVNAADTYGVGDIAGVLIQSGASSNGIYSDVISGNLDGVMVGGAGTTGNFVYFNEIGTNASGTIAIGNQYAGVYIIGASGNYVLYNTVAYNFFGILSLSTDRTCTTTTASTATW